MNQPDRFGQQEHANEGFRPLLNVKNLTRPGIAPVDLAIGAGECLILGGPSGAGKTLLLRAIADLDPNDGDVFLEGVSRDQIPAPRWRRMAAYVPSESGWWAERVGDHFTNPETAAPLLDRLGLDSGALTTGALDWPVSRLSTGERQRLALARALAMEPKVLLLDEPTSGLDPDSTRRVEAVIAGRLTQGAAALFVTHDAEQAMRLQGGRLQSRRLTMNAGVVSEAEA